MKITYDTVANAVMIYLTDKEVKVNSTTSVTRNCLVDLDEEGNVVAIELLNASKYINLSKIVIKDITK